MTKTPVTEKPGTKTLALAAPDSVGMSKAALDRVDAHWRRRYIETGRVAGAQILVYRRGKLVHNSVQGSADLERNVPVRDDTIYRIYSMTKPVTAVAFMMLVEEARVALDDPVDKYIPEWKGLGVFDSGVTPDFVTTRPKRPMLIVDLLRHTAGLSYHFHRRSNVDAAYREAKINGVDRTGTLEDMIAALAKIPLQYAPGEAWDYSVASDVLGYLIGKISGQPFDQFLKARIFDPLGMDDTGFHVPADKAKRLAACYSADPKNGTLDLQDDPATSAYLTPPSFFAGGSGLCSTGADYLTFSRALLHGGAVDGVRLLAPKTVKLMTMNQIPGGLDIAQAGLPGPIADGYAGIGFGLGFAVTLDPVRAMIVGSPGEFTWGGAASTTFWVDPAEELIVVYMTQLLPAGVDFSPWRELRTLIYAAITDSNA